MKLLETFGNFGTDEILAPTNIEPAAKRFAHNFTGIVVKAIGDLLLDQPFKFRRQIDVHLNSFPKISAQNNKDCQSLTILIAEP